MERPRIGSAATWAALRAPRQTLAGSVTGYGLGLFCSSYRGLPVLHHPGGVMGGNAQALKSPAIDLDVVVILNRQDVSGVTLANAVLDACVDGLNPTRAPPPFVAARGVFRSAATGR